MESTNAKTVNLNGFNDIPFLFQITSTEELRKNECKLSDPDFRKSFSKHNYKD